MPELRLVPAPQAASNGIGLAVRAFVDAAMQNFTRAISDAPPGSAIERMRAALGEEVFLATARASIERHVERVLGSGELIGAAAEVSALAVDAAVLDVVGEVIQDIAKAAWPKVSR